MSNPVFDLLGEDGHDIESLTAYALYKRHKRSWAAKFEEEEGRLPSSSDDAAFARVASTPDQLDRYRKDARDILLAFSDENIEGARPSIEREAITARVEQAASKAEKQSTLGQQLLSGLLSSSLFTVILIGLAIFLEIAGVDLLELVEGVSSEQVSEER